MLNLLKEMINRSAEWVEIRYHKRIHTTISIKNGDLEKSNINTLAGAGVRVLADGSWGFVSTSDLSKEGLSSAIAEATAAAKIGAKFRKNKIAGIASGKIAQGRFDYVSERREPELKEKINTLFEMDQKVKGYSDLVITSSIMYDHFDNTKVIVNSDGCEVEILDLKQDIGVNCVVKKDGKMEVGGASTAATGTWDDMFKKCSPDELVNKACQTAEEKLAADYVKGGQYTVILDPELVGLLAHEAIGHTVEADFVLSGSVVKDKIGERIGSELVTLIDDGNITGATGMVLVDDEGTLAEPSIVIDKGILTEYLHNRESAHLFNTQPKGNARAYNYRDEPIIRMTNTCIMAGSDDLDEMIAGIDDGYLLEGFFGMGQADSTGEFMFGVSKGYQIKDGKLGQMVKGITISGQAFDVLKSVDAVSKDYRLNSTRGFCGKGQPAKTDDGGPYIRCQVTIGGQQ